MRNCDECFYRNSDECSKLTCIGFKPSGYVDPEVLENAAERLDNNMHNRSRYSSRKVEKAKERVKEAIRLRSTPNTINLNLNLFSEPLYAGQVLWYKNKFTGAVEHGVILNSTTGHIRFRFQTGGKAREAVLPKASVGRRLFLTEEDAIRYGKANK